MSELIPISARSRSRHRPYHRWSADEKARYLEAFRRSGLSGVAFCREMDIPLATFAIWKREARRTVSAPVGFARVDVVPTATGSSAASRPGIRLVVRGTAGHEAALDGVDAPTALQIVALVLGTGR